MKLYQEQEKNRAVKRQISDKKLYLFTQMSNNYV